MIIDNPIVSGSLTVQNNVTASNGLFTGNLTVEGTINATVEGTTATASYVAVDNVDGFSDISSSLEQRVSTNETNISTLTSATSSYLLNTTDTLTGDLTVTGKITAQEFHTEFVSASIIYQSGSTKFGDTLDDNHQITGSVNITGSLFLNGTVVGTGKLDETVFNSYTSSTDIRLDNAEISITSLNGATGSYALQANISGAFVSTSSSLAQRIAAQESFSSSLNSTFATDAELSAVSGALAATISGISTDFADITNKPTLISSSLQFNTLTTPFTGSFTGSFFGDGSNLSGVTSYTDADTLEYINSLGVVSGSAQINSGSFSGSFQGDGSSLTGITVSSVSTVQATFSSTGSVTINHNFNSKNVSVNVYNSSDVLILPDQITLVDNNNVKIDFAGLTSGFAVVARGGHLVSGSVLVPQVSTVSDTFTSATSHTITHNFNTKEVMVSVYENDILIFPDTISTPTLDTVQITFPEAVTGRVVVVKAGHIVSGSIPFDNIISNPFEQSTLAVTASKHIVPSLDQTYDLGSPSLRFRDLYLSSASIYLGNTVLSEDSVVTTASLASVLPANVVSSSAQIASDISGSFTSVSSSLASRISSNEGSVNSLNQASSSYLLNTTDTLVGDLTVTGTITAQEFHTEFVSASILYDSGSTKFGNSADDVHSFTGSVNITGTTTVDSNIVTDEGYVQIQKTSNPSVYLSNRTVQWQIYNNSSNNLLFKDGISDIVTIGYNGNPTSILGGNVLIGTSTNSSYKLDVNGTGRFSDSWSATTSNPFLIVERAGSAVSSAIGYDNTNTGMYFGTTTNHRLALRTNNTDVLTLANSGAATFSSSVTATDLTLSSATTPLLQIIDTTNSKSLLLGADDNNTFIRSSTSTPILLQVNGGDSALTLASSGAATFSSSVTTGGNITVTKTTPGLILNGLGSGNSGAYVNLQGWAATNSNWQIGVANIGPAGLLFIPSTTAGGTTFSSAVFTLSDAGAGTFASSVTAGSNVVLPSGYEVSWGNGNTSILGNTSTGYLDFKTSNSTKMYIDSDGNVGIGSTDPLSKLYIGAALENSSDAPNALTIKQTSTNETTGIYLERSGERKGYYIYVGGSVDSLNFQRNNAGTKEDTLSLTRDGNVGIGTTSPGVKLDVSGTTGAIFRYDSSSTYLSLLPEDADGNPKIKFGANGGAAPDLRFINDGNSEIVRFRNSGGITFNGDTAAANALDDYEEGTWTPTVNSGTATISWAKYTKIGDLVFIACELSLAGTRDGTIFEVSGLPFTNGAQWTPCSFYCEVYNAEGTQQAVGVFRASTSIFRVHEFGNEAVGTQFGNGYFTFAGTYKVS